MKRSQLTLPTAAACVALLLAGCPSGSTTADPNGATRSWPSSTPTHDQSHPAMAPLIRTLARSGRITPGLYFLPVTGLADDPSAAYHHVRAIVKVPDGYFADGGHVVQGSSDSSDPNSDGGTLVVAWGITGLDPGPCGSDGVVGPDLGVREIANALAPRATTVPRPVTIGGSDGLYLEIATPQDLTPCRTGARPAGEDQKQDTMWINRLWILDVGGHRIVVVVKTLEGSQNDSDPLVHMARNLMFVTLRAPH